MDTNMNILDYLKPNNQDFYNKVIEIVKYLETISSCDIYIYGGFIRNIMDNYYSNNNLTPTDIDLWFNFDFNRHISYNYWKEKMDRIIVLIRRKYQIEENYMFFGINETREKYGLYKIKINGITFDFCTKINDENRFNVLCDYTVNNFYINTNGKLYTRINTVFKIDEILNHIENKKLILILNNDKINSYIDHDRNKYYYYDLLEKRKNKMIGYGYS